MKIDEAIKRLRGHIDFNKENKNKLINIDIPEQRIEEEISVWELAIQALEKQVPKNPLEYDVTTKADCPVCKNIVRGIGKPFGDWCAHCGQKLDWSVEE